MLCIANSKICAAVLIRFNGAVSCPEGMDVYMDNSIFHQSSILSEYEQQFNDVLMKD